MTPRPRPIGHTRRQFLTRSAFAGGALLLPPAFLAACGDDDDTAEAGAGEQPMPTIDLQFGWLKNMQYGGPYMALEQGYYDAVGVTANHRTGGPSVDAVSVVTSGNAHLGLSNSDELAVARGQGIPVVMLAAAFQRSPNSMISLAESPVLTLEEQYGKTVAVSDSTRPIVEGLMTEQGLDPSQVNFVPKSENPAVLADGQVDVYWGFVSTEGAILRARGVEVEAVLLGDLGAQTYGNVYFTTDEILAENRDAIRSFLAADLAGWQWMVDNPDETAEFTHANYQEADEDLAVVTEQARAFVEVITAGDDDLLYMDPAIVDQNIEDAVATGLLDETFDSAEVLDTELLAEAREEMPS